MHPDKSQGRRPDLLEAMCEQLYRFGSGSFWSLCDNCRFSPFIRGSALAPGDAAHHEHHHDPDRPDSDVVGELGQADEQAANRPTVDRAADAERAGERHVPSDAHALIVVCALQVVTRAHMPAAERDPSRPCPADRSVNGRSRGLLVSRRPTCGVPAPLPEPVLPARSRIPAITGALCSVLIVVASGESPLRSTCLPAILVCP